ncbi:hypothetical protein MBLNU459_g3948t1 [Dothideomycetes sp. NU459]
MSGDQTYRAFTTPAGLTLLVPSKAPAGRTTHRAATMPTLPAENNSPLVPDPPQTPANIVGVDHTIRRVTTSLARLVPITNNQSPRSNNAARASPRGLFDGSFVDAPRSEAEGRPASGHPAVEAWVLALQANMRAGVLANPYTVIKK